MRTSLVVFLFAFAVASAAATRTKQSAYSANLNKYLDSVISNFQQFITDRGFDSIPLPNNTQSFSVKPILITYSGRLSLFEGLLQNLDTFRRYGDVTVSYENKIIRFRADFGVDKVNFKYQYDAKLIGFLTANGRVVGTARALNSTSVVITDLNKYTVTLDSFSIPSLGKLSVALRDNVLTDWLANAIISIIVSVAKNDITDTVETKVFSTVTEYLDKFNAFIAPTSFS